MRCKFNRFTLSFRIFAILTSSLSLSVDQIPDPPKWHDCQRKRQQLRRKSSSSRTNILLFSCGLFLSQLVLVTAWNSATGLMLSSSTITVAQAVSGVLSTVTPNTTTVSAPAPLNVDAHRSELGESSAEIRTPSTLSSMAPAVTNSPHSSGSVSNATLFRQPTSAPDAAAATTTRLPVSRSTTAASPAEPDVQADDGSLEIGQPPLPPQFMTQCAMSEHTCDNGRCIPLNKYCDNVDDCGDSSDEPRFCTSE